MVKNAGVRKVLWRYVMLKGRPQSKGKVPGRKEWLVTVKWLDQIEDVILSKNNKARAMLWFRAIGKYRGAIGMSPKKGILRCKTNNSSVKWNCILFPKTRLSSSFSRKLLEIFEISLQHLIDLIKHYTVIVNISSNTNIYTVKWNHIFFPKTWLSSLFSWKLLEILEISLKHLIDLIKNIHNAANLSFCFSVVSAECVLLWYVIIYQSDNSFPGSAFWWPWGFQAAFCNFRQIWMGGGTMHCLYHIMHSTMKHEWILAVYLKRVKISNTATKNQVIFKNKK